MPSSRSSALIILSLVGYTVAVHAWQAPPSATQLASQEDRQKMLDLLHITSLRTGANGSNPAAPNAANYDESKANPYPTLPDPLTLKNGRKVTTAEDWWSKRRPEIVEDFDREVYGRLPKVTPAVKWEVTATTEEVTGEMPVRTKKLIGHVDNSSWPQIAVDIQLTLTTPANAAGPVPVIMEFGFTGFPGRGPLAGGPPPPTGPTWQEQVLAKGWGYAILSPISIQADNGAGLTQGIIGLLNKGQPRKPDDWGALRAWAWGASRALDYFETDKAVDAKRVGVEGHSRYGKATIVAMSYDPRFAIAFVSSSGEGGAKIHRRAWGELVENVAAANEYHWMAGNFLKYAGPLNWNDLPVDSHELVALCAPRPVFISAGATKGDGWVDAKGMFEAAAGAGPVYKLLGKKDMGTAEFPVIETSLINGDIAFRQHSGGHTPAPNWPTFITFASRYLSAQSSTDIKPGSITYEDIPYPFPVSYLPLTLYGQDVRMAYMDVPAASAPNGRTVVLLHGMNFGGFYFSGPINALRNAGFRVIVPDQIGFGRSSKPIIPYNFHDMALNTRTLLKSLGVTKAVIFGHSMGGMLAARFSASYPEVTERTILCDPIGLTDVRWQQPWHSAQEAYQATMARTHEQAWQASLANIQRYFPDAWKSEYEQYVRILYAPTLSGDWPRLAMVRSIYQQITYLDPVVHDWAHIKAQTLVIGGERDGENFPALAKHIADSIPGARLVLFPNVGHVPHIQIPEKFNAELLKFLQ